MDNPNNYYISPGVKSFLHSNNVPSPIEIFEQYPSISWGMDFTNKRIRIDAKQPYDDGTLAADYCIDTEIFQLADKIDITHMYKFICKVMVDSFTEYLDKQLHTTNT